MNMDMKVDFYSKKKIDLTMYLYCYLMREHFNTDSLIICVSLDTSYTFYYDV